MCIVFIWKQECNELFGKLKFILAANRDEFFYRTAKEAHYWEGQQHVLAGQDLSQTYANGFGTWLGVTKYGKISYITNMPAAIFKGDEFKGRGELVSDFLKGRMTGYDYLSSLQSEKGLRRPFNLVCGNVNDELYYTTNAFDDNNNKPVKPIKKGFSYMTNDVLECEWLKAVTGLKTFSEIIRHTPNENLHEELLTLMEDTTSYHPDPAMPDYDGRNIDRSSIFVPLRDSQFGTRTNTIITVDKDNYMTFLERTKTALDQCPSEWSKSAFSFKLRDE